MSVDSPKEPAGAAAGLEAQVWQHIEAGEMQSAIGACRRLNMQHPDYAPGWHTASQLALKINNPSLAMEAIERALRIEPDKTAWLIHKATVLLHLRDMKALRPLVESLLEQAPDSAYQCSALAMAATQLELRREAIALYRRASELKPGQSQHYYNIAVLHRTLGEFEEAERNFDTAIRLNPTDWESWKVRSEIRRQSPERNHVRAMEKALKRGIDDPRGKAHMCFGLAKELEDLGEWQRSFHYLKTGADTRRSYMRYDVSHDLQTMRAIGAVYGAELFDGRISGYDSTEPIFIIGMPRTGTTLVERILASHSEVFSAGELNDFTVQMMAGIQALGGAKPASREDLVQHSTAIDFKALGQRYIESTRPATGHTVRFIDKLPLNFLYAGLIHLALPDAKIINLRRNPMDTCYAVYKQLFVDAYPFSYDLEELAQYFIAYSRLMAHWNEVMPGVIHTLDYERLVEDVEGESRRLVGFCGLEWQDRCLKFYESREASTTASSAQVRQPVYSSSVGKWRNFKHELKIVTQIFDKEGIKY
jgi:tetratricopeptide (TPR) repeat protein